MCEDRPPLTHVLCTQAVKQEMGLTDLRITPEIGNRRGSDRQLRYRAWPAASGAGAGGGGGRGSQSGVASQNAAGGAGSGGGAQRSASADASPYASGEEGDDSDDDDRKSVRSDKSPLRGRAAGVGHHHKHHPHAHAHQPPGGGGKVGGVGDKKPQGGGVGSGAAAGGAKANGAAPAARRSRIPGVGGVAPAARQIDLADGAFAPQPPAGALSGLPGPSRPVERIKSGRRAGQHKAAPAADLAELPAVLAGLAVEPAGLPPRAGGRLSDAGGGGGGPALVAGRRAGQGAASAGMDFDGVQLEGRGYGRRRHTVAHGHESGGPDTSDEALEYVVSVW